MEIIRAGRPVEKKPTAVDFTYRIHTYTCKLCGCVWECDEFDKSSNNWRDWEGLTCPCCHEKLFNDVTWSTREETVKVDMDEAFLVRCGKIKVKEAIIK